MRIEYSPSLITTWLDSGYRLSSFDFTFSIPNAASTWPGYDADDEIGKAGFALPDAAMGAAFARAIGLWDELIAPDFREVADTFSSRGQLRIAITEMDEDNSAYAYYPSGRSPRMADIWFNEEYGPWDWTDGRFDFYAMLHELGHALGLKHSFEDEAVPTDLDTRRYTTLSYTSIGQRQVYFVQETGGFFSYYSSANPATPMVLDIAAVQAKYGADPETRAGDTVYTFTQFDASLRAIYDAGGTDTLDLSSYTLRSVVDLRPGAYSSIGIATAADQIAYWAGLFPDQTDFIERQINKQTNLYTYQDNLGIALGTVIENARGGAADDRLTGNSAANAIEGNGGNDLLVGLEGADRLIGGGGDDILHGEGAIVVPDPGRAGGASIEVLPGATTTPPPTPTPLPPSTTGGAGGSLIIGNIGNIQPPALEAEDIRPGGEVARVASPHDSGQFAESLIVGAREVPVTLIVISTTPVEPAEPNIPVPPTPTAQPTPPTPVIPVDENSAPPELPAPPPAIDLNALPGDPYDDTLDGGDGNDVLHGGIGRDNLIGGAGADRYLFDDGEFSGTGFGSADTIRDFSASDGDVIDLSMVDAIGGGSDDAFVFIGPAAFGNKAGELRYEASGGFALLSGDMNGDGLADFALRLDGVTTLAANNFIL